MVGGMVVRFPKERLSRLQSRYLVHILCVYEVVHSKVTIKGLKCKVDSAGFTLNNRCFHIGLGIYSQHGKTY